MDDAPTLREKLDLAAELTAAAEAITRRFQDARPTFFRVIAGATLDALEAGELSKLLVKPAFAVVKKGMEDVIPDAVSTRRFTGLVDLMEQSLKIAHYESLLRRVFGSSLDIRREEIAEVRAYRKLLATRYDISTVIPT